MNQKEILAFPKDNNLDLLRLIFGLQVALIHLNSHMGFDVPRFISSFPGVAAFFLLVDF